MHPLSRLGQPEDISNATLFLLDSKNSWITGQILNVDGGLGTLRLPAKI
ncbi:MAG: SDR family oxidoreductase [Candidatus Sericytochromatia bacterium]